MIPVILSGGSGTRLWPVSRQQLPKQFCEIFEKPLQTMTLQRVARLGEPWIITSETLRNLTEINLHGANMEIGKNVSVLFEPFAKNTAPAIAVLCRALELQNQADEVVGIFPSDHLIQKEDQFLKAVRFAEKLAQGDRVVTLGIHPTYPETGYGYIQINSQPAVAENSLQAFAVVKFHEKPPLEKAKEFLSQGNFDWNAGIFIFKVSRMIELFKQHQPQIWSEITKLKSDHSNLKEIYSRVGAISMDYAIMEKLNGEELYCIPCDLGWNDVGSWDSVSTLLQSQTVREIDCGGNFVLGSKDKSYSFVGLDEVIAVDMDDALLLVKKGHSQDVKILVDQMTKDNSKQVREHNFESRPWGDFKTLREEDHFKSKVVQVHPKSQISYQSHAKRQEHWIITRGSGEVVLNEVIIPVKAGSHVHIPLGAKHRIRNTSAEVTLEFVEVQLGTYFGEDDIVRYQDDYKRI